MAGLLTSGSFKRLDNAARLVEELAITANSDKQSDINGIGETHVDADGPFRTDDMYPHTFEVSLVDDNGTDGVWVFLESALLQRFYDISQDASTPSGAQSNHTEYGTGAWCRAFGACQNGGVFIDCEVYFIADYSTSYNGYTPFAFVILPSLMTDTVPPFLRVIHVASITADGEVIRASTIGVSFDMPRPDTEVVVGYGLRLTNADLLGFTHPLFSVEYADSQMSGILTPIAHNSDVRTFVYETEALLATVPALGLGGPLLVGATSPSEKNVTFTPDSQSTTVEAYQKAVSLANGWLCFAVANNTNTFRLTVANDSWYIHDGYLNTLPEKSFTVVDGRLATEFVRDYRETFYYSHGYVYASGGLPLATLTLPAGVLTGYVVQQNAQDNVAQFTDTAPSAPPEGSSFPALLLVVAVSLASYEDMFVTDTFALLPYMPEARPTEDDPLTPGAIDIAVCTGSQEPIDFNDDDTQKGMRFPTADPSTGKLTGCAVVLRLPVVPPIDDSPFGVTYVEDATTKNRKVCLHGVTEAPQATTQQRVYSLASDGTWGLYELEMLFQLDANNKRFYYNPQKYTDNGTQKVLDADHPTDKFDFQWDSNTYNGIKIQLCADVRINPSTGALEKSYRYLELPKVLVAHVSAMSDYVTVIEKQECS